MDRVTAGRVAPSPFSYTARSYRTFEGRGRWVPFRVQVSTTDLYVLAGRDLSAEALSAARRLRSALEAHAASFALFATSLRPLEAPAADVPPVAARMYEAAAAAGVGPMAAVAGALAEAVGTELGGLSREVIVENGGDIYLKLEDEAVVSLFAGDSPFSGRLGLRIPVELSPLGVCTSSATVGPSLSFGRADAATVLAPSAALADAVATGLGNRVQGPEDLEAAVEWALGVPGVLGAVAIIGDRLAARGTVEFVEVGVGWGRIP